MALAAVISLIIAVMGNRSSNKRAERAIASSEKLHRENTRPRLVASLQVDPEQIEFVWFEIRNYGGSPALKASISFDPKIDATGLEYDDLLTLFSDWHPLTDGVPVIAPGDSIRTLLEFSREYKERATKQRKYKVVLQYSDSADEQYDESFEIDVEVFKGMAVLGKTGHTTSTSKIGSAKPKEEIEAWLREKNGR